MLYFITQFSPTIISIYSYYPIRIRGQNFCVDPGLTLTIKENKAMTIHICKPATITLALTGVMIAFNLNTGLVYARGNNSRPQGGPPQEAFTACEGKSEGDTASFEASNGETITGTCRQDRNGDRLLLIPDNAPQGRGQGGGFQGND